MEAPQPDSARSERVGRYVLDRSLGSGGMGEVYKARAYAAAGVRKDLCIKRIRRERLARPAAVERFVAEARTWMQLAHGNIVQVFDFGRAGDEYFLAMEWVDGADLRAILDHASASGDALEPEVAAHVGASIARALAYAHRGVGDRSAVVHCDVKPENVLVSLAGEVKLTDFGAAAVAGEGALGGTAEYMPPEHREGGIAGPAGDLYSLGVVLVEMLTGARPRALPGLRDQLPEGLAGLVEGLLDPDASRRPQPASRVAEALEDFVSRARTSGGVVPQNDLALRAEAARSEPKPLAAAEALLTEASYVRDGGTGEFGARMTATTMPPPAPAPEPAPTLAALPSPAPMPSRRRRRAAAAVISTLGALGLGVFLVARAGHAPDARDDVDAPASARSASAPVAAAAPAPEAPEPRPPADAQATPPVALPSAAPEAPAAEPRAARPTKQRGVRATDHGVVPQARSPRDEGAASSEPVPRIRDEASVADPPPPPPGEPARLNVNAIPWAEVRVDGRLVGETPVFGLRVPSGAHVIELRNPALGVDRRIEIDLAAGESREVVIELR